MSIVLVVGAQFGGEGKGAVTAFLSSYLKPSLMVKCGGPNASHSFGLAGRLVRRRMLPSGCEFGCPAVAFPAGSLINPRQLEKEIREACYDGRIIVDPHSGVISDEHIRIQMNDRRYDDLGSTRTGTGSASAERCLRRLQLASNDETLRPYLGFVAAAVIQESKRGIVIVEGTQGYGLSNYHGEYPYVTSRDTTAAAFLSEVGIGPAFLSFTLLVVTALPSRNAHGRGPLPLELDTEKVQRFGLLQYGGGSYEGGDSARRVGLFDWEVVHRAVNANTPNAIALTGLDRLESILRQDVRAQQHYGVVDEFVELIEKHVGVPVVLEGWGPCIEDMKVRRSDILKSLDSGE
jgi:adenylosuccinate synthase